MNMSDKPVPAALECQSEIDKDLVRTYYGDIEAFYRVRAALAATPAVGGEVTEDQIEAAILKFARDQGREINLTYDKGSYEVTTPTWLAKEFARAVLALAPPASPLRPIEEQIDAALNAWFKSPPSETDQGLERSMKAALIAADAIRLPASPLRGRDDDWRDDPSSDERWNAGVDCAMKLFCDYLGVDPSAVTWDAATETVDGDISAVIGNILRTKYGEDWSPASPPEQPAAAPVTGREDR